MRRSTVIAIIPAAGCGKRLGLKEKKALVLLGDQPIIAYSLGELNRSPSIDGMIIAADKKSVEKIKVLVAGYGFGKVMDVVEGGKTRQESVANCLKKIDALPDDIILIHDAARPFLNKHIIDKTVDGARRFGACIIAVPERDTVKLIDKNFFVQKTLDRNSIFRAETPQAFRYSIIKKAYASARKLHKFTDDASLVEGAGFKVKIVVGDSANLKITTKEDLRLAEELI